jgi:hypothetical protein
MRLAKEVKVSLKPIYSKAKPRCVKVLCTQAYIIAIDIEHITGKEAIE